MGKSMVGCWDQQRVDDMPSGGLFVNPIWVPACGAGWGIWQTPRAVPVKGLCVCALFTVFLVLWW